MTIIYNASTDGSVEMPKKWKVKQGGQFLIWHQRGKRYVDSGAALVTHKLDAFNDIMREQYGIKVK